VSEPAAATAPAIQSSVPVENTGVQPAASVANGINGAGIAAGVIGGAAVAMGAVIGGKQIKKKLEERKAKVGEATDGDSYDPEDELEKALQRVRDLESDNETPVEE